MRYQWNQPDRTGWMIHIYIYILVPIHFFSLLFINMPADTPDNRKQIRALRRTSTTIRKDMAALVAPLHQSVCSEYPGGPEGYRYVPEHCVLARRADANVKAAKAGRGNDTNKEQGVTPKNTPPNPRNTRRSSSTLTVQILNSERAAIAKLFKMYPPELTDTRGLIKLLDFDNKDPLSEPGIYITTKKALVTSTFILEILPHMISLNEIRRVPNPEARFSNFMASWQDGILRRSGWDVFANSARRKVYSLANNYHQAAATGHQ